MNNILTFLYSFSRVDALYLYITKNQDWMMVWIERCQQLGHTLTWECVSSLVKEAPCNGYCNVTQAK